MNESNIIIPPEEVKQYIRVSGIPFWRVANKLGYADSTFSRKLRYPVSSDQYAKIKEAINDLKKEMI